MSIFDRLFERMGYRKTEAIANPAQWLRATADVAKYNIPTGEMYSNQAELYQRLSWVHTAVSIVSSSCAVTPFGVKKLVGEEEEEISNHPFETLLRKPNPLMSRYEFLQATVAYQQLTGNAYWWLNRPGGPNQEPTEMWIIPSNKIRPEPDEHLYLKGYIYDPGDGTEYPLELHEIAHFKRFHPLNQFVGLSPVEAIAVAAIGDMEAQKWNTKLFGENNARLPGILAFADSFSESDWKKMQAEVDKNAKERNIMMMQNVGPDGVNWMQAAMSQKDMEFLQGREFSKEEIYGIFAPGLASMMDVNATEANANTGERTYSKYGLWPLMVSMSEKITNDVLPVYGDNLIGEFDDIRVTDKAMELQEQEIAAKVKTLDEMRQEYYQLEPIGDERGEMLVAQIGAASLGMGDEGEEPEGPIPAPEIFQTREPAEDAEERGQVNAKAVQGDLGKWERKAAGRVKAGKSALCSFESEHIPLALKAEVMSMLAESKTTHDVTAIFEAVRAEQFADYGGFGDLVDALGEATKALREKDDHPTD